MHGKFTVLHVIGKEKVEIMRDKLRISECSVYVQRSCGPHCASACRLSISSQPTVQWRRFCIYMADQSKNSDDKQCTSEWMEARHGTCAIVAWKWNGWGDLSSHVVQCPNNSPAVDSLVSIWNGVYLGPRNRSTLWLLIIVRCVSTLS